PDIRIAHRAEARARQHAFLDEAKALRTRSTLDPADALTLDEFVGQLETWSGADDACRFEEWNVAASANPFAEWNTLPNNQPANTVAEAKTLLRRYRAIPGWIDANIENLAHGASAGTFGNARSMTIALQMVDGQLAQPDSAWALSSPRKSAHADWSEAERPF